MIEGVNWTREAAAAGLGLVRYSGAEIGAEETDGPGGIRPLSSRSNCKVRYCSQSSSAI